MKSARSASQVDCLTPQSEPIQMNSELLRQYTDRQGGGGQYTDVLQTHRPGAGIEDASGEAFERQLWNLVSIEKLLDAVGLELHRRAKTASAMDKRRLRTVVRQMEEELDSGVEQLVKDRRSVLTQRRHVREQIRRCGEAVEAVRAQQTTLREHVRTEVACFAEMLTVFQTRVARSMADATARAREMAATVASLNADLATERARCAALEGDVTSLTRQLRDKTDAMAETEASRDQLRVRMQVLSSARSKTAESMEESLEHARATVRDLTDELHRMGARCDVLTGELALNRRKHADEMTDLSLRSAQEMHERVAAERKEAEAVRAELGKLQSVYTDKSARAEELFALNTHLSALLSDSDARAEADRAISDKTRKALAAAQAGIAARDKQLEEVQTTFTARIEALVQRLHVIDEELKTERREARDAREAKEILESALKAQEAQLDHLRRAAGLSSASSVSMSWSVSGSPVPTPSTPLPHVASHSQPPTARHAPQPIHPAPPAPAPGPPPVATVRAGVDVDVGDGVRAGPSRGADAAGSAGAGVVGSQPREVPTAKEDSKDPTVYVSLRGSKYHYETCRYAMGDPMPLSAAKQAGLVSCPFCVPVRS